jgi:cation diffusion facilitator CzcD-associated flavoprotein CzcO
MPAMQISEAGLSPYCIIGAGPSGLAAAAALKAHGIPYDHFERHDAVGGIWDLDNPGTPMYESAHLISSKTKSGFPGFPMPSDYPDYPKREQVLEYLRSFARTQGLLDRIQFGCRVTSVVPEGADHRHATVVVDGNSRVYRGVICASGVNWQPVEPQLPGEFHGELRHSVTYRSAKEFEGKRVLIVGLGNTGADIACDAAKSAIAAYVSVRRGYYFLPKHVFGKPADVFADDGPHLPLFLEIPIFSFLQRLLVGDTRALGMPKPDHRILEAHPLVNDQLLHHLRHGDVRLVPDVQALDGDAVLLADGQRIAVDLVLFATGYKRELPYLDARYLTAGEWAAANFLTVFNPGAPCIFTLGFVELNGALYPHVGRLATLIAKVAKADLEKHGDFSRFYEFASRTKFDLTGGRRMLSTERHTHYCDSQALDRSIRKTFKAMGWPLNASFLD